MSAEKTLISRPVEQTPAWTFASALSIFHESHYSEALEEFFLYNKDVLLSPLPFHKESVNSGTNSSNSHGKVSDAELKRFTLRGVLYEGATDANVALARAMADWLSLDVKEVLRVMLQTKKRIPEDAAPESSTSADVVYMSAVLGERKTILKLTQRCFESRFGDKSQWMIVTNVGKSYLVDDTYTNSLVSALIECHRWLVESPVAPTSISPEAQALARSEVILYMTELLRFLHELLLESTAYSPGIVQAWFQYVEASKFGATYAQESAFELISALCTLISLKMLELRPDSQTPPFFEDVGVFSSLTSVICASSNSVVKYGLLLALYKKSVCLEETSEPAFADSELSVSGIERLVVSLQAELGNFVFAEISSLAVYVRFYSEYAVSLVELVLAALPVLSMNDEIVSCICAVLYSPSDSVQKFFESPDAQQLFVLLRAKFPMVMVPFLKMAAINDEFALHELKEMRSYMQSFDATQFKSLYEIDDDNTSLVRLSQGVDVYPQYENSKKLSLLLQEGTKAQVFQPEDPNKVWVTFLYTYNGWSFLGRVLENISKSFDGANVEKMALLSSILELIKRVTCHSKATEAMDYLSAYTDNADVLDVLFRLLEQCLHHRNAELSATILAIFTSQMSHIISRLWPYLSTSVLFSSKGKEGFASILFSTCEMVREDYSFTMSLVDFASALVTESLSTSDDYAQVVKSEILVQVVDHFLSVFSASCNYNDRHQKFYIGMRILNVFKECLEAVYSIAPETAPDKKPTRIFAPAADKILDAFLLGNSRAAIQIFESIDLFASFTNSYLLADKVSASGDLWTGHCIEFSQVVLKIRNFTNRPPSEFEKGLFRRLPEIVTIYAKGPSENVLKLLSVLASGKWPSQPSMLSHLGPYNSRMFLQSLASDLENPLGDEMKIPIYEFLCTLMEANQQGLSVYFISGRDVFGEVSAKSKTPRKTVSLLSILKKNINDINYLPPAVTVHLLDAVSLAFSQWTIARDEESDLVFVQELIGMMGNFEKAEGLKTPKADEKALVQKENISGLIRSSYQCKLYAKVAETLSLLLFTSKNEKCKTAILNYLQGDDFASRISDFFSISDYNTLIYDDVNGQFSTAFAPYQLSDFAVNFKQRNHFGVGEVYNRQVLSAMFGNHEKWSTMDAQIRYCGANIQYYNAQSALGKAMGGLLTTFCRRAPQSIPASYSKVACQLLTLHEPRDTYTQESFQQHNFGHIELAFLLLYTAYCNRTDFSTDAISIVEASLDLMGDANVGYLNFSSGDAYSSQANEYSYRSLLRILYISLSQIGSNFELVALNHQILMRAFDFVVSKGTRGLVVSLENSVYLSRKTKNPEKRDPGNYVGEAVGDFELILSILKVFTQMKLSRALQSDIMASVRENMTVEAICSLYTFSHLVLVGNNEPVFAQLSLMFIQNFLSMDEFCDNLGQYNLFMVIRESVISQPVKEGGVSVDSNVQLHRNWTNGILPILVTCLKKNTALEEVILTMRAFQRQIEFAAESWTKDSASLQISTAGTFETMQVLYMFKMLHEITTARGMSIDSPTDVDMSILPGFDTPQKRAHFGDFVNNLLKHPKFLASRIVPSSKEEEVLLGKSDAKYQSFVGGLIEDITELKALVS